MTKLLYERCMLNIWNSRPRKMQMESELKICKYLHAAAEGDLLSFRSYLDAGLDLNSSLSIETIIDISKALPISVVTKGKTALEIAIENARSEIVYYILYQESQTPMLQQPQAIDSLFVNVINSFAPDIKALDHIALMLLDKGVIIATDALCQAASKGLNNTVAKLLAANTNPNQMILINDSTSKTLCPITSLGYAIINNNHLLANILLEYHASLEICTNQKTLTSTFALALQNASFELLIVLHANLTDAQKAELSLYDLLHLALKQEKIHQSDTILQIAHLLNEADLARTDHQDGPLLFAATKAGCVELVQHILNRGVNAHQMNKYRQSAVFLASQPATNEFQLYNKMEVCNYFPNQNPFKDTPNLGAIVSLLASHGVDLNYRPYRGKNNPPIAHAITNHLSYAFATFMDHNVCLTSSNLNLVYLSSKVRLLTYYEFILYLRLMCDDQTFIPLNCPFARINKLIYKIENLQGSLITLAALSNNESALNALLNTNKLSMQQKHNFVNQVIDQKTGRTLLMFLAGICGETHHNIVRILLKFGVITTIECNNGRTAADYADVAKNYAIAAAILSHNGMSDIYSTFRMTKRTLNKLVTFQFDEAGIKQADSANNHQVPLTSPAICQELAIVPYNPNQYAIVKYQGPRFEC